MSWREERKKEGKKKKAGSGAGSCIPCGNDAASGSERHDVGGGYGADGRTSRVVGSPGEESGTSWEGANRDQEDAAIAEVGVGSPSYNGEASNGWQGEDGEVETATVGFVRDKGNADGNDAGANIGGD